MTSRSKSWYIETLVLVLHLTAFRTMSSNVSVLDTQKHYYLIVLDKVWSNPITLRMARLEITQHHSFNGSVKLKIVDVDSNLLI